MQELRERLLNILPIFILLCVAIVLIWSLFTNASTITETSSETTNQTTEVKKPKDLCEEIFIQEVNNTKIWHQNIDWAMKLLINSNCDYTYQQVADAIWFDDWLLCPIDLWREYWRDCTNHLNDWYPWKLTADWNQQEIPEVKGTSHEKFKQLCELYWLDASLIRSLENKYNLREGILLAILIAETSWGNNWNYVDEWCYNLGNVGNTDSWQRVCFEWKEVSIEQVAITLNNRMLGKTITLWCLSNAGSCQWRDDWGYRYATSNWNRERNVKAVMNMIYADDLGEDVDPARFVVKRVNFQ